MHTPSAKRLFDTDDYYKMAEIGILQPDARVELIQGEIINRSPINSFHASIINLLNRRMIIDLGNSASISIQNSIHINQFSEPEPDLAITHYRQDEYRYAHPRPKDILLLIEVSDSSLDFDRGTKKLLYAKANILEFWIINLVDHQIEVYRHPRNGDYLYHEIFQNEDVINATLINFEIKPSFLFFEK